MALKPRRTKSGFNGYLYVPDDQRGTDKPRPMEIVREFRRMRGRGGVRGRVGAPAKDMLDTPWGERMSVEMAAKRSGIPATTLRRRVRNGWQSPKLWEHPKRKKGRRR